MHRIGSHRVSKVIGDTIDFGNVLHDSGSML
jgi:hypothetical protein